MEASVQYNDFIGTVSADTADYLGSKHGDSVKAFGRYFNIDESRFEVIGLSIYGTENDLVSLICIDTTKTVGDKDYYIKMFVDVGDRKDLLPSLFKRINILLHDKFDDRLSHVTDYVEVDYEDYHEVPDEEE